MVIIKCPYCGTNFKMEWEYDEKEQELVVRCPACERIILRTQGFSKLETNKKGGGHNGHPRNGEGNR